MNDWSFQRPPVDLETSHSSALLSSIDSESPLQALPRLPNFCLPASILVALTQYDLIEKKW